MSSTYQLPLTSIEPQPSSPFSPRSHYHQNHSHAINACPPYPDSSPEPIPNHHSSFDQPSPSSPPASPYQNQQPSSSTRTSNSHHVRNPSQSILTIALAKAQTAVQLDTALQIPEAIRAYTEAVLLLEEVIDKIDVMSKERDQKEQEGLVRDQTRDRIWAEELWNRLSRDDIKQVDREEMESRLRERERRWRDKQKKIEKRKKARADEEDRLIGIHNTYASRIAELQAEVLSGRLDIIDQDEDSNDPSTNLPSNDTQEPIEPQPVYPELTEAERTSISSDSTTRGGPSEIQEPRTTIPPLTRESSSLSTRFRSSLEITQEEKDFNQVPSRPDFQHSSTSPAAVYGIQPYAHASLSAGSIHVGGLAPAGVLPPYPKSASRRPFHLMRQISTSISTGAYVSPRLYVPRQMWFQVQVKLHGLETKIKLMDTLLAGLELVERDGGALVGGVEGSNWDGGGDPGRQPPAVTLSSQVLNATEKFMKRLEIFEELLDNLQTGGAKKLGLHGNGPHETAYGQDAMRKSGGFGTLMAHKLGKGLDRITQRSNTDLPTSYIETIARLFEKSQAIDVHLASLEQSSRTHSQGNNKGGGGVGLYNSIGQQSKQHIEGRLRRVSEFYSTVVCRFVVADMGVLLDKYIKRGGNWCGD